MIDQPLVLRFRGLRRSDARELADNVGAEATIVSEESPPVGGYGDLMRALKPMAVTDAPCGWAPEPVRFGRTHFFWVEVFGRHLAITRQAPSHGRRWAT